MEEEKTISIKKSDLWKYSTLLLLAVVVIGGVFLFTGNPGTGNAVNTGTEDVDLGVFTDNPSLFPSLGPENADNVVLEFSDFQCPYCAMASGLPSWTSQYQAQYGDLINSAGKIQELAEQGELRFIYVPMSFLGQESVYAAEAGYCANEQGKFWEMHDKIFAAHDMQENNGKYSKDKLKILAQGISGLDSEKFNKCLDDDKYSNAVQQAAAYASTAATGTPTFYVNGQKLSGSWTQLSATLGI
ncbi:MAG: thioredoxin domain-containing protein [archaeon]